MLEWGGHAWAGLYLIFVSPSQVLAVGRWPQLMLFLLKYFKRWICCLWLFLEEHPCFKINGFGNSGSSCNKMATWSPLKLVLMLGLFICVSVLVWRRSKQTGESLSSFYNVGPGDWTLVSGTAANTFTCWTVLLATLRSTTLRSLPFF